MGVFTDWQQMYAEFGIATIPLNVGIDAHGKKELRVGVKHGPRFGVKGSTKLVKAGRHDDYNAIAAYGGPRSRIVVADVDMAGDEALRSALAAFGDTPLITQTASGKWHVLYRWQGERTTSIKLEGIPIDVRAEGGMIIMPPSIVEGGGSYRFVRGALDDLPSLPPSRGLPKIEGKAAEELPSWFPDDAVSSILENEYKTDTVKIKQWRNSALFSTCLSEFSRDKNRGQVLEVAMQLNESFQPSFSPKYLDELVGRAELAHKRGHNGLHGKQIFTTPVRLFEKLQQNSRDGADACMLYLALQRYHWRDDEFDMSLHAWADQMCWTYQRIARARMLLERLGAIEKTHDGGVFPGDAARFRWAVA